MFCPDTYKIHYTELGAQQYITEPKCGLGKEGIIMHWSNRREGLWKDWDLPRQRRFAKAKKMPEDIANKHKKAQKHTCDLRKIAFQICLDIQIGESEL